MTKTPETREEPRRRLSREEARRQTRERLLDAAAVVFDRVGYTAASLDAVAEAAGYTKGAVYSNFATKSDLFLALLERWVTAEADAQAKLLETQTLEEFIDGLGGIFEQQTRSDPQWILLQLEFFLAAARDPAIREKYVAGGRELTDDSGHTLDAKLAEMGVEAPFTGRELGILLNALASGLAIGFYLDPEDLDPSLLVRAARILFGFAPNTRRR